MNRTARKLWLLHLVANAALISLAYRWLGIGDSNGWQLFATVALGLAILFSAFWLHAGSFVWFRDHQPPVLKYSFVFTLRHVPAFAAVAVLALLAYSVAGWLEAHAYPPSATFASWLTLHLRRPVTPSSLHALVRAVFWILRWLILPPLLLPLAAEVAAHDWRGFWHLRRLPGHLRYYWLRSAALVLIAFWVPGRFIQWVPAINGIGLEISSFLARLLAAYLLCVSAWLALVFVSAGGRPRSTQPSTSALP